MENEFDENRIPGKLYVSPSLPAFGDPTRNVRIVSKVLKSDEDYAFAEVKKEVSPVPTGANCAGSTSSPMRRREFGMTA